MLLMSAPVCMCLHVVNRFINFGGLTRWNYLKIILSGHIKYGLAAGQPHREAIADQSRKDKLAYKPAIRAEQQRERTCYTNDLHEALLQKSGSYFWKCPTAKCDNKRTRSQQVDGLVDDVNIASAFAEFFFAKAYSYNSHERFSQLKHEYDKLLIGYIDSIFTDEYLFDVQLVDALVVRQPKFGNAPGLDNLKAEHLIDSHRALISILVKLICLFLKVVKPRRLLMTSVVFV